MESLSRHRTCLACEKREIGTTPLNVTSPFPQQQQQQKQSSDRPPLVSVLKPTSNVVTSTGALAGGIGGLPLNQPNTSISSETVERELQNWKWRLQRQKVLEEIDGLQRHLETNRSEGGQSDVISQTQNVVMSSNYLAPSLQSNSYLDAKVVTRPSDVSLKSHLQDDVNNALKTFEICKSDYQQLQFSYERSRAQLMEAISVQNHLQETNEKLQRELTALYETSAISNSDVRNLRHQVTTMEASLSAKDFELQSALSEVVKLQSVVRKLQLDLEHSQAAVDEAVRERSKSEGDLTNHQRQFAQLRNDYEREQNLLATCADSKRKIEFELDQASRDVRRLKTENNALQTSVDELMREQGSSRQERDKMNSDLVNMKSQLNALVTSKACFQEIVESKEKEISLLKLEKQRMMSDIDEASKAITVLRGDVQNYKGKTDEIDRAVQESRIRERKSKDQIQSMQADLDNALIEIGRWKEKYEQSLLEQANDKVLYTQNIHELTAELNSLKLRCAQIDVANEKLTTLNGAHGVLQNELLAMTKEVDSMRNEYMQLQSQYELTLQELSNTRQERHRIEAELVETRTHVGVAIEDGKKLSNSVKSHCMADIQLLQDALQVCRNENVKLGLENQKYTVHVLTLEKDLSCVAAEKTSLEKRFESVRQDAETFRVKNKDLSAENEKLQRECSVLKLECSKLQQDHEELSVVRAERMKLQLMLERT
eukprot:PhF_6_TR16973/c0_g1_i2/m.25660